MRRTVPAPIAGRLACATLLLLTGAACSNDAAGPQVVASTSSGPTGTAVDADVTSFITAVHNTSSATSLSFTSTVRVSTTQGVAEVRLEGSKNGPDRMLVVRTDGGELTYVVTDGVATVDRGQGPQTVTLSEVPATPTLDRLVDMTDLTITEPGVATGRIEAGAIVGGDAGSRPVDATVTFEPDGFVRRLELRAPDGTYTATVAFTDIVA